MKHVVTGIILILFMGSTLFGQVRFGATAGYQAATHTPEDVGINNRLKSGFMAGVMVDIPLSSSLSLRPQVLYSMKGVNQSVSGSFDAAISLNYLEIPLQLVYTTESETGRLSFGGGLYVAYGLSSKSVVKTPSGTYTFHDDFGASADQFKRTDIGARLSIDYEIPAGFTLGIFYSPGLITLNNSTASTDNVSTHNSALGVSVGYWLTKR